MKPPTFLFPLACTVLLGAVLVHADSPALTAEQRTAKAAFDAELPDELEVLHKTCGAPIGVAVDWATFDQAAWVAAIGELSGDRSSDGPRKAMPPGRAMARASVMNSCRSVIEAVVHMCRSDVWKPILAREVKTLACSFKGYQPRRADESANVHVQKQVRVSGGTVTLNIDPRLIASPNLDDNIRTAIVAGYASSRGAPPAAAKALRTGENGAPCDAFTECNSRSCIDRVCRPCASTPCQRPGATCSSTPSGGICLTAEERARRREEAARSEPSERSAPSAPARTERPKGASSGRMCGKPSDCQSGVCKMENRTRGRCQ